MKRFNMKRVNFFIVSNLGFLVFFRLMLINNSYQAKNLVTQNKSTYIRSTIAINDIHKQNLISFGQIGHLYNPSNLTLNSKNT